jgi:hypothetical protein
MLFMDSAKREESENSMRACMQSARSTAFSEAKKINRVDAPMEQKMKIEQFLDSSGKIKQLPQKQKAKCALLEYLAGKFEPGRNYSERDVNMICNQWHTFNDYFLLRRELVDHDLLCRERDGSQYWRTQTAQQEGESSHES